MKSNIIKFLVISLLASVWLAVFSGGVALAHVVVTPKEAVTAGYQTFAVNAPNEKAVPVTSVRLVIPAGLSDVSPTVKPGWQINIDKDGVGETANIKAISWSGGVIDSGLRDEFTFSAKVPSATGDLQWKAYQTYADGTIVAWDKPASSTAESDTSGPMSITKVVSETADAANLRQTQQVAASAASVANRGLYVGVAGVVVGLAALFMATRRR